MADMIYGFCASQTIRAFVELSIPDHLRQRAMSPDEVAAASGSAPETTARLLRAGIVLGLVCVDDAGQYEATPLLGTLSAEAPRSLRGMALGATNNSHWAPWAEIPRAVRTGRSRVSSVLGMGPFEYLAHHPVEAGEFTAYMQSVTALWAFEITSAVDTRGVEVAADIGGASGSLMLNLLRDADPALRGIVFDRPDVADAVAVELADSEFHDRIEAIGGDFFEAVPVADLYLLKFILHDWDDEHCVRILQRCRESMRPGGRIAVVEMIVGQGNDPGIAALMDLNMLAVTGGRERSIAEYDTLLTRAGLQRTAVWRSGSPQGVIEAVASE